MLNPGSHFRRRLSVYLVVATVIIFLAGGGFVAFESSQVSSFPDGLSASPPSSAGSVPEDD